MLMLNTIHAISAYQATSKAAAALGIALLSAMTCSVTDCETAPLTLTGCTVQQTLTQV